MPGLDVRLKRMAISAFVVAHVVGVFLWNMPACAIRERLARSYAPYILATGLWQSWSMFAPDPVRHTFMLEAIVGDSRGMIYDFTFPRMSDFSSSDRPWKVRHSKYVSYMALDEFEPLRQMAAKHAVRNLTIPAESFPIDVELQYRVRETPSPGKVPDPMASTVVASIKTYRFNAPEDIRP